MAKTREQIPRAVRDRVLREFNHRCSVCGADRPHLHHIDEDPSNNDPENVIPLCPNYHVVDQHDASNAISQAKLLFFKKYKHRLILKPQFNSVWRRLEFLTNIADSVDAQRLEEAADELVGLVGSLAMGLFYAGELKKLIKPPQYAHMWVLGDAASEARLEQQYRKEAQEYRVQLRAAKPAVERLIVELLDHQPWS